MHRTKLLSLAIVTLLLSSLVISCNAPQVSSQPPAATQSKEDTSFKVGVIPILDVLPVYVAEKEGLFKDIKVEIVPFRSAVERDTAMQTGQLDAQVNDLVSTALLDKDADVVRVTRLAMHASADHSMFAILAAPNSGLTDLASLGNGEVAISSNTIIEYATDYLFNSQGISAKAINKTEVASMPVRLEMLQKGQVKAATLPEPLASAAVADGAKILISDGKSGMGSSTLAVSTKALQTKPSTVKSFLAAYDLAVNKSNSNPESYRDLMVEVANVPPSISKTFGIPDFPKASVPTEAESMAVWRWMVTKGLLTEVPTYSKLVDTSLLPQAQ